MVEDLLSLEQVGATVDQAVASALTQLGCSRADVDVEILRMPTRGFFGFLGRKPALVRVVLTDRGCVARAILEHLLSLANLSGSVAVCPGREVIDLIITSEESSLIIGRHGQTLEALQLLTVALTDRLVADRTRLVIDIDRYRVRRERFLRQLAGRLSGQVKRSGQPVTTDLLSPDERRIIHQALKGDPDIAFRSIGQGFERKVFIAACGG
ncbi:MAG: Jag N-terminal domain-containing protein [Desulfuromonadales bacterium]|nr:Jag N-terminal domain-containing protein [Desulfuromonadales bacterium]MDT8422648.1 RNA-binding cell elongation regulator Jag/EloR [Desulfuromonadales bacterium]